MSYVQTVKVLILGNSGVGKTNIMERYTTGQFYDNWITTVGIDFRSKMLTIAEKQVKLQIWDTAGQERYRTIVASYYRGAHAIILVYDVTDKSSFDDVKNWLEQIHLNADHGIEILIVGNKVDLEDKRTVSYEQGKKFADDNSLKFFEVSAKSGVHVDDVFFTTATDVLNSDHFQKRQQQTNTVNMNKKSSSSSSGCCGGGGSK